MNLKIPDGYRRLKVGELVEEGDMFWYCNKGPWTMYPVKEDADYDGVNESIGHPVTVEMFPIIRHV